ncbi:Fanconi anemia group M protein isoform X2 [Rhinoderma darwinii]|uniref:Fanconi anemia group M protein isoform X2 n=1 Tax=Rhinoderma darwinii TaxID=43563 RepID=UPI003F66FAA1
MSWSHVPGGMNGKQRTLFQTWGSGVAPEPKRPPEPLAKKGKGKAARKGKNALSQGPPLRANPPICPSAALDEDDDDVLLVAVYEAEKSLNQGVTSDSAPSGLGTCNGRPICPPPNATDIQNLPGFDLSAGSIWIYPTNYPVREYQYNMAHAALLCNTLVCLPTGLGKTFIAAVVMYNFYRWYPSGKIVFMAPTKPLVAQQIEACFRVMGIPQGHMAEMTGSTQAQNRKEIWQKHRVFFLTPQIMVNDLTRGACPACDIKCLVIDEAHKSLGNHAYCQVVRELINYSTQFRILALSATPGSDAKSVQQVVSNLLISRIELRSEDSPDIQPYSHERQLEKFVVPLGDELAAVQKTYIQVLETFARRLIQNDVLSRREIPNLTKYQIILSRDQFRKNPPSNIIGAQMGVVEGDFALCISLYHGYELLLQMGTRSLFYYLRSIMDGSKGMNRARNDLGRNSDFMNVYQNLESQFASANGSDVKKSFIYSHPKLKKLEEVVVQHFKNWNKQGQSTSSDSPENTRIMIFSSFRDSVQEIADMLNQHHPTVRVMTFVGHSSTGKGVKGFTQKEQLEVVKRFREGGYNTLVSTCVGEEGLDIGEVDLIICFDAQKSPIRLVQRMGRTGRKRQGRIVVILCKGREERTFNQSQSNKRSIYKAIMGNNTDLQLYQQSPRMVPDGINPMVHKMFITQGTYDVKDGTASKDRRSTVAHRKSSVFFNAEDSMKADWLLTNAEFETWKKLYRLEESDGMTDVILPKTHFEFFKDANIVIETVPGEVRKLSLSEWSLWQNRPFPTDSVDHSHRCKNFIAVMELIEQMRLEETDCKYDEEMKAFLQKEVAQPLRKVTKDSRVCPTTSSKAKKKLSVNKNAKISKNKTLFSVIEPDEDFRSTSKASKSTRSRSTDLPNTDSVVDVSEMEEAGAIEVDLDHDVAEDMEIDEHGESTKKPTNLGGLSITDCQRTMVNSLPKPDPGYISLGDDTTTLISNFFYTPPSLTQDFPIEIVNDCAYEVKKILSRVTKFLTFSPPPLTELDSLVNIEISAESLKAMLSSVPYEHPPSRLQGCYNHLSQPDCLEDGPGPIEEKVNEERSFENIVSTSTNQPDGGDNVETDDINGVVDEGLQPDPLWDDLFDCDDEEAYVENVDPPPPHIRAVNEDPGHEDKNIEALDTPTVDRPSKKPEKTKNDEINIKNASTSCNSSLIPDRDGRKSDDTDIDVPRAPSPSRSEKVEYQPGLRVEALHSFSHDLDDSFDLFEDAEFAEIKQLTSSKAGPTSKLDHGGTSINFNMFDPSLLFEDSIEQDPEDQACLNLENSKPNDHFNFDGSQELFSVNFDLGFSIEDLSTDDEQPENEDHEEPSPPKRIVTAGGTMSTPLTYGTKNSTDGPMSDKYLPLLSPLHPFKDKFSPTPEKSRCASSFLKSPTEKLAYAKTSFYTFAKYNFYTPTKKVERGAENTPIAIRSGGNPPEATADHSITLGGSPESGDDVVYRRKRKLISADVLRTPGTPSSECDFDSPMPMAKKRRHVLNALESDDENFDQPPTHHKGDTVNVRKQEEVRRPKHKKSKQAARQFFDDEAELSSEDAEFVSSDESFGSENEQETSLVGFLNDNTQLSQGLNDSEMHGIYLKSVISPAVGNRFKLVHKRHSMAVFSQIPEQDESYTEDSFCVEEEEEEVESNTEEEVQVDLDLLEEDRFVGGRKQYRTRRMLKLKDSTSNQTNKGRPVKKKRRIIVHDDSSDEGPGVTAKSTVKSPPQNSSKLSLSSSSTKPPPDGATVKNKGSGSGQKNAFDVPLRDRCQMRLNLQASLSNELDFQPEVRTSFSINRPGTSNGIIRPPEKLQDRKPDLSWMGSVNDSTVMKTPVSTAPCILADSREISSGPEVITYLRTTHGVRVDICSLGGCDYIVSNRLSVERKSQSEFSNNGNRSKLVDRIQHLCSMFERVCLIVEKDRVKPGETSRLFQRTKYYDSTLSSLIGAGVQVLFSSGQEETAVLLKELASLEQRKNTGITVPSQVSGHQQEALNFYLSIPNVSYITALNLCHHFSSVIRMSNSSVEEIANGGKASKQKAEEIYRYLRYVFDPQMLQTSDRRKPSV